MTANRLSDGAVVYLALDGVWVEDVIQALVAHDADAAAALEAAGAQAAADRIVVEPYLIDVLDSGLGPKPLRYRERIRAQGPSVRLDLGYQAGTEG